LPEAEAAGIIVSLMTRPPQPADEVRAAVAKAYGSRGPSGSPPRGTWSGPSPVPLAAIQFDEQKLLHATAHVAPRNWRRWLWERSPQMPSALPGYAFLAHLYRPGEIVLVFDVFASKRPVQQVWISAPMTCQVPRLLAEGGRYGAGIWFLCNPVDGRWHDTGGLDKHGKPAWSCRNWQAITAWRYAVLESDEAPSDRWLAFVAQLPLRVAALYTSGGRSTHCLFRVDARSKAEWDSMIAPLKRPLKVLGADAGALSAVRLTRLPGCWRPDQGGVQKLLFLNPDPPQCPLLDLPILASRASAAAGWRATRARRDLATEAFR